MTDMYDRAVVWEADALRLLSIPPVSLHCTHLLDEFTIPGRGSAGSHMCFVMPVYGGDVKALNNSRTTPFPLPLAKRQEALCDDITTKTLNTGHWIFEQDPKGAARLVLEWGAEKDLF